MIHHRPSDRAFGISVGGVTLLFAGLAWWRGRDTVALTLVAVGGVLLLCGLIAPLVLKHVHRGWWKLAVVLGWVNSRVLLTVLFVLVLTPVGLLARALGRSPLRGRRGESQWHAYTVRRADPRHYEHLF
jgi:hypothetical protein